MKGFEITIFYYFILGKNSIFLYQSGDPRSKNVNERIGKRLKHLFNGKEGI